MKPWGVIQFPGSNCDHDALRALQLFSKKFEARFHWHEEPIEEGQYDVIVVPGGFSFGDYLRAGSIAKLSPATKSLQKAIEAGAHAIGICNGFQILLEAGILPGMLQSNTGLRFISRTVPLRIKKAVHPWFSEKDVGKIIHYPIAHGFGNYQPAGSEKYDVAIEYVDNPNGSYQDTAGIYRKIGKGSAFGLMPHPERASFETLNLIDGKQLWENAVRAIA